MKNANTILSLESIPKATIYSKYGESLDKLFKSRSLKNLISELKNPKKYISKEYESPEEKPKKKIIKYNEEDFKDIFSSLQSNLDNKNKKNHLIKEKSKTIENENEKEKEKEKFRLKKLLSNELNDIIKYNPNYSSISKNIPSVHMILTEKEIKELKKMKERQKSSKKILNLKKKIPKIKTQIEESFITLMNEGKNKSSRNNSSKRREQPLPPITKVPNQRSLTLENEYNLRNNHALRFSKYISRKFIFNDKDQINKISYLEPYDYLNNKNNNIIDFNKMSYRKDKDLINYSSLGVPSIYDYNPKYDLVEKKTAQIVFAPHNDIKNSKQYLLKKLWGSYDLSPGYKLINNNNI